MCDKQPARETPISGQAFFQSLPSEVRALFPEPVRRIVIDISHDDAVRIFCETYATASQGSLIEAALRVGTITEVTSQSQTKPPEQPWDNADHHRPLPPF